MEFVLQTENLTKNFKNKTAVNNININVKKGDIYGFIGKNGAGKSTFMKIICGMVIPDRGKIKLFEYDRLFVGRKRIGAIIETPSFYPSMSVEENMKYYCIVSGNYDTSKIAKTLDMVGLSECMHKKAKNLSLGMKQRLAIAIAMIGHADFLILDEPINGLDPIGIKEIRELLLKLNREKNITILISSHILGELSKIATRYGIIDKGSLVDEFDYDEIAKRCKKYISLDVDDTEKAYYIIREKIGTNNFSVIDRNTIKIYDSFERIGEINKALIMNDVEVRLISKAGKSFEKYLTDIIGGE